MSTTPSKKATKAAAKAQAKAAAQKAAPAEAQAPALTTTETLPTSYLKDKTYLQPNLITMDEDGKVTSTSGLEKEKMPEAIFTSVAPLPNKEQLKALFLVAPYQLDNHSQVQYLINWCTLTIDELVTAMKSDDDLPVKETEEEIKKLLATFEDWKKQMQKRQRNLAKIAEMDSLIAAAVAKAIKEGTPLKPEIKAEIPTDSFTPEHLSVMPITLTWTGGMLPASRVPEGYQQTWDQTRDLWYFTAKPEVPKPAQVTQALANSRAAEMLSPAEKQKKQLMTINPILTNLPLSEKIKTQPLTGGVQDYRTPMLNANIISSMPKPGFKTRDINLDSHIIASTNKVTARAGKTFFEDMEKLWEKEEETTDEVTKLYGALSEIYNALQVAVAHFDVEGITIPNHLVYANNLATSILTEKIYATQLAKKYPTGHNVVMKYFRRYIAEGHASSEACRMAEEYYAKHLYDKKEETKEKKKEERHQAIVSLAETAAKTPKATKTTVTSTTTSTSEKATPAAARSNDNYTSTIATTKSKWVPHAEWVKQQEEKKSPEDKVRQAIQKLCPKPPTTSPAYTPDWNKWNKSQKDAWKTRPEVAAANREWYSVQFPIAAKAYYLANPTAVPIDGYGPGK